MCGSTRLADSDKVKTLLQVHLLRREPGYPARTHKHDTNAAPDTGQDRNSSFRPQRRAVFILHAETRAHPGRSSFDRSLQDAVVVCDPEHFTGARDPGEANVSQACLQIMRLSTKICPYVANVFTLILLGIRERAKHTIDSFKAPELATFLWSLAVLNIQPSVKVVGAFTDRCDTQQRLVA